MSRDFVPCVYHEREVEHPLTGESMVSCDIIELHQCCILRTQTEDVLMGTDAHQFTLRGDVPSHQIPARLRAPLFAYFYSAMAELED